MEKKRKVQGVLGILVGLMLMLHAGGTVAVADSSKGSNNKATQSA